MTAGFASTSDARKRNAEIQHGSVRVGSAIVPARRLGSGQVLCDGVPVPQIVALTFKEKP